MAATRAATTTLFLIVLLAACGGEKTYHHDERFAADSRHKREFSAGRAALCDATRRVLLGQGYVVSRSDEANDVALLGQKEFKEPDNRSAVLQVQALCSDGAKGSVLLVTALESHFDLAKVKEQKSLGLPLIAPLSVVSSTASASQIKLSGETVEDRSFYEGLFRAVEKELGGR